jgi:hypothetical protein
MICSMMPTMAPRQAVCCASDLTSAVLLVNSLALWVCAESSSIDFASSSAASVTESTLVCVLMRMPAVDCDLSRVSAAINDMASGISVHRADRIGQGAQSSSDTLRLDDSAPIAVVMTAAAPAARQKCL